MKMSLTSDVVIEPNAAPMITPTAMVDHIALERKRLKLLNELLYHWQMPPPGFFLSFVSDHQRIRAIHDIIVRKQHKRKRIQHPAPAPAR